MRKQRWLYVPRVGHDVDDGIADQRRITCKMDKPRNLFLRRRRAEVKRQIDGCASPRLVLQEAVEFFVAEVELGRERDKKH
jgi:hypothetical protein